VLFPTDADEDLVEMPLVTRPAPAPFQRIGEYPPETQPPFSDGFIADDHAARGKDQLNLAQAQTEAVIQPHCMLDLLNRKAKAAIGIRCHHAMDAATAGSGLPT
jgi:hypothetical protein